MQIRIPLKIHCWGGLGSQLYAWALFERLQKRFPQRNVQLILHSDGVTRRISELDKLFSEEELFSVDDFKNGADLQTGAARSSIRIPSKYRISKFGLFCFKITKRVLMKLGFVSICSTEFEFTQVRLWAISVRGHYSKLKISSETFALMKSRTSAFQLYYFEPEEEIQESIAVHFRLGDLLELDSKRPIEAKRISTCIAMLNKKDIFVLSDSPETALKRLSLLLQSSNLTIKNYNIWDTIKFLISVDTFIGSPSKISEWVTAIRIFDSSNKKLNFLPLEMKSQMETILELKHEVGRISYY